MSLCQDVNTANNDITSFSCVVSRVYVAMARFSKAPEMFRARKAIFSPETSCMKGTSVHINSMSIKTLCGHKV